MKAIGRVATCFVAIAFLPHPGLSQPASLKEMARQSGGRASVSSDVDLPALPLSEMVRQADLIVEARLTSKHGVLSPDESTVFTDYGFVPVKLFKDRAGIVSRTSPGTTSRLIARQPGGRVTVDGLELAAENNLFSSAGLDVGAIYVTFLRVDAADGVFRFLRGPYGVFAVDGAMLRPPRGEAASSKRRFVKEKHEFYKEIETLLAKLPD